MEVGAVGFNGGVGVGAPEGDSSQLLPFAMKPSRRRELDSVRVAVAMSGKMAAMR